MEKKNTDFKGYSGVRGVGFRHVVRCVYDCIFHLHVACNRLLHSQMYFIFGIYDSNYIHLSAKIIFLRFLLQLSNQKRIWFCNKVDVLHATIKNTIFFSIFFFIIVNMVYCESMIEITPFHLIHYRYHFYDAPITTSYVKIWRKKNCEKY